jgi:hypothetical protein
MKEECRVLADCSGSALPLPCPRMAGVSEAASEATTITAATDSAASAWNSTRKSEAELPVHGRLIVRPKNYLDIGEHVS